MRSVRSLVLAFIAILFLGSLGITSAGAHPAAPPNALVLTTLDQVTLLPIADAIYDACKIAKPTQADGWAR